MDSGKPEGCFGGLFKPKKAGLSKKNIKRNLRSLSRGAGKNYPVNPSDYSLYDEVGVSSTAKVYRALCVPFKEVVAIKVLDLGNWNSNLDEICCKMRTMALINHPNVLRTHCSFVVDQNLWVVMPYMARGSCLHLMKAVYPNGFEELVIAVFLLQVLKALDYLHSQGQIHGNVKAANILVDASGAVALADFDVSACIYNIGNTQYSRKTFVGTSYWTAPEFKKQHAYGPKVDIWSFGITALELSHGHAPFMKYSPMKVLNIDLQNGTQGNDYERHKNLSKSFLEIIATCLIEDPRKRPSAKKLLKHPFFKNAQSNEVVACTILDGLPPLGDQLRELKLTEVAMVEQKKVPYEEKEDISQIQDNDKMPASKVTENPKSMKESAGLMGLPSFSDSPETNNSARAEATEEGKDHTMQAQSESLEASLQPQPINGLKGHADALENDISSFSTPDKDCIEEHRLKLLPAQKDDTLKVLDHEKGSEKECKSLGDSQAVSLPGDIVRRGPIIAEDVHAQGGDNRSSDKHQHQPHIEQKLSGSSAFHRMNVTQSTDCIYRQSNSAGNPDNLRERSKPRIVQQKGRFRVMHGDMVPEETLPQPMTMPLSPSSSTTSLAVSSVLPVMQRIAQYNATQRDHLVNLIKSLSQAKNSSVHQLRIPGSKSSTDNGIESSMFEASSEMERELLQHIGELQARTSNLEDEIQKWNMKNTQLERQLNTIGNKDDKRIRITCKWNETQE